MRSPFPPGLATAALAASVLPVAGLAGDVTGIVLDAATGMPIPGAAVRTTFRMVSTDGGGRYRVPSLRGEFVLEATHEGYEPASVPVKVPREGTVSAPELKLVPRPAQAASPTPQAYHDQGPVPTR